MKITTESIGERQVAMTIEVDEERLGRAKQQTAREISREVDIAGFRKGKAPYEVVVQRLGPDAVRQELVNVLAEDVYREALEEEDIVPYAPGTLEQVEFEPLRLQFVVPLTPEVELGDYRSYRREFPEPEVSREMVERALERIQEQNAILNPVDRTAAEGDLLVGSLVGRASGGAVFLDEEEARILLEPGEDEPIPGLVESLVGLEAGEESTFKLTLPTDFAVEELQGEEAEFSVEVENVYERILPELDDDLARTVGKYDSYEELEEDVRNRLRERQQAQAEGEYAEQVLGEVIEEAEVSYPPILLEEALDEAVESYEAEVERREHMMLKDYLRIQGRTMDDVREELAPEVQKSLKRSLVLGEIVEREGLEVSEEELDVEIAESSEKYGERAEEVRAALSTPGRQRNIRNRMLANKAIERLVTIAKGDAAESGVGEEGSGETKEREGSEENDDAGA
ncbi:MAG: trigger factor [Anaerolineae bacterium]